LAEVIDGQRLPRATLTPKRRGRVSAVWLIPLFAALVAVAIAVDRIINQGPTISILFTSSEGVEAGKTVIKYKDVKIGEVSAVELHDNFSKVLVTAKIDKHAEDLMVKDASFWVVQPRVTLSGVSGLGTLLSGNYIGFEQGKSKDRQRTFVGLEKPPVIRTDQPGKQFELTAADPLFADRATAMKQPEAIARRYVLYFDEHDDDYDNHIDIDIDSDFSATSVTTLGYGDIVLPKPWRQLGPLIAIHGVLLFGCSTAFLFVILQRVWEQHL